MGEQCIDCGKIYDGRGTRCPSCYVKFALGRKVRVETVKSVLEEMRSKEGFDISGALEILEKEE